MKKLLLMLSLACLGGAFAPADPLYLKNSTGSRTFYAIRVSMSDSNHWGSNLLVNKAIGPGEVFKYEAPQSLVNATVDIFVEDDKGGTYTLLARKVRPRLTVEVSLRDLDQRSGKSNAGPDQKSGPHAAAKPAGRPSEAARMASNLVGRADPDAANWDIAALDTARDANYLSPVEKDVILETNKVRTDPKKYAALYIRPMLQFFKGNDYAVPGQVIVATKEGARAVNDCIAALNKASGVGVLTVERGLHLSARDHTVDQGRTGQTGHTGSDGSTMSARIKRHGAFAGSYSLGENIMYGCVSGRDIVCGLLIDDGVPSRGHRVNIMNKEFSQTGVAVGPHRQFRTMCAINYASGYKSD
jgi:uncharacterized protein YkwD